MNMNTDTVRLSLQREPAPGSCPATETLFRKEAVAAKSQAFASKVTLDLPLSYRALSSLVFFAACALVAFLILGTYTHKDTAIGYVTTTEGNVKVYPQSSGTILQVLVHEGDMVRRGQSLFSISTSRANHLSPEAASNVIATLVAEETALLGQIDLEMNLFAEQDKALVADIASTNRQLGTVLEQKSLSAKRRDIAQSEADRLQRIPDPELVSTSERDRATAAIVEVELRQAQIKLEIDRLHADESRHRLSRVRILTQRDVRLAQLQGERARIARKIAEYSAHHKQTIVATASGRVSGLNVRAGQTVSAARPLLSLIPEHGVYRIELLVPSRTIGFVTAGSAVNVRIDAFPHQKYGAVSGVVDRVSRSVVMPGEIDMPVLSTDPAYIVTVTLARQSVQANGKVQQLQAGMTVSADILGDRRRLIEWMFSPLISAARRI